MMLPRSPNNNSSHFHTFDRSFGQSTSIDAHYERRLVKNSSSNIMANNHSNEGPIPLTQAKYTSRANLQPTKQLRNETQAQYSMLDNASVNKSNLLTETKGDSRFDQRSKQTSHENYGYSIASNKRAHFLASAITSPSGHPSSTSFATGSFSKQDVVPEDSRLKYSNTPFSKKQINYSERTGGHTHTFSSQVATSNTSQSNDSYSNTQDSNSGNGYSNNRGTLGNSTSSKEITSSVKSQPISANLSPKNSLTNLNDTSVKKTHADEPRTTKQIPNYEPTKCSAKSHGVIRAYAANTNQGLVRNYNEDRVSIILNINKPASRANEKWPKCSFFGVFDGHGGHKCADFLRDSLHQFVIKESSFPNNPTEAIIKGFEAAEKSFLELAQRNPSGEIDRSGSCAVVALIVGDMCYLANVGDSRAVMSGDGGLKVFTLSRDHKPLDEIEQKRIVDNGGKIYQSQTPLTKTSEDGKFQQSQVVLGPHRVSPGRLSVSRAFGDIEAKLPKLGGNPGVVIATPDVKSFKINHEHDFIVLACDGIFDKLTSKEVVRAVWKNAAEKVVNDVHQQSAQAVDSVLLEAVTRKTSDNITVVFVAFKNFEEKISGPSPQNENLDNNKASNNSYKTLEVSKRQQKGKLEREGDKTFLFMNNTISSSLMIREDRDISGYLNKSKEEKPFKNFGESRQGMSYGTKSESMTGMNYFLNADLSQNARNKIHNG